jgi:hypothetical protein
MQEANGKTGAAGRRGALKVPESWLEWGRKESDGEEDERQDGGLKNGEGERCKHTGMPIFGLPPVPLGEVAAFI